MAPGARTDPEPQEEWAQESTDLSKIRTAYEKGAAAILLYNPDAAAQAASGFRAPRGQEEPFVPARDFLALSITDRTFRTIMKPDFQESVRGFTTRLNAIRNEIKYGAPQSATTGATAVLKGYDAKEEFSEELGNNFAYNVVAKLPGTDRGLRDEFVVMGGHLDHLGVRDGQVYNGADDNASGTAVAMEVARVLREGNHRPRRTIVFAAWCGEELGLIGSNYFVSNPPGRDRYRQGRDLLQHGHGWSRRCNRCSGSAELSDHLGRDQKESGRGRNRCGSTENRRPRGQRSFRLHQPRNRIAGPDDQWRCRAPLLPQAGRRHREDRRGDPAQDGAVRAPGRSQPRRGAAGRSVDRESSEHLQRHAVQHQFIQPRAGRLRKGSNRRPDQGRPGQGRFGQCPGSEHQAAAATATSRAVGAPGEGSGRRPS